MANTLLARDFHNLCTCQLPPSFRLYVHIIQARNVCCLFYGCLVIATLHGIKAERLITSFTGSSVRWRKKNKNKTETIGEQGLNCPLSGMGAGWRHYWNLSLSRGQEWLVGVDKIIDNGFAKQHGEIIVCLLLQTMRGLGIGRVEWEWAGP